MEQEVILWLNKAREPVFSKALLDQYYQTINPRVVFLKNIQKNGRVLDLGAGRGELAILRDWPNFSRADLELFAVALDHGRYFDRYKEAFIGDFEKSLPKFSCTQFHAIVCAHFIEHISDCGRAIRWMADSLVGGGRAYVEWPHACSKKMPKRDVLLALGYSVSTINFFDDSSHVNAWEMDDLVLEAQRHGCVAEVRTRIVMPYIAEQMRDYAVHHRDETMLTFAIWSFFGWAQCLVIRKCG